MKNIRKIQEVQFDNLNELKEFVDNGGHAEFYNDWGEEYFPIRIDAESGKPVIGSDGWDKVEDTHLSNIYGFITII